MGTRYTLIVKDENNTFHSIQFPHDGYISGAGHELYLMSHDPKCIMDTLINHGTTEDIKSSVDILELLKYYPDSEFTYVFDNGWFSVSNGSENNFYNLEIQLMKLNLIQRTFKFKVLNFFFSKIIIMKGLLNGQ